MHYPSPRRFLALCWIAAGLALSWPVAAQTVASPDPVGAASGGPYQLRQPVAPAPVEKRNTDRNAVSGDSNTPLTAAQRQLLQTQLPQLPAFAPVDLKPGDDKPYPGRHSRPSEFERYIQRLTNSFDVRCLGADLVIDNDSDVVDVSTAVPPDYVISPGDEVLVSIWGAADGELRATVDRAGRLVLPRIGAVPVAGVKYQDLAVTIQRQARQVFKNFELTASLAQLRGVRVYVTGFADRPGAYSVSSLSSVSSVLFRAGGPSGAGSYRNVELRRRGQVVAKFDLYDLIVNGKRDADLTVQAGDVIYVGPVGRQVAILGSVNRPAIVELKANETIADTLPMVGGFNTVADRSRITIERLGERSQRGIRQLVWPDDRTAALESGDVVRVFSAITTKLPQEQQNKRVVIEGEVLRPGEYVLPPGSTIRDLMRVADGLTPKAFLYGAELDREAARKGQVLMQEQLLRDLELEVTRKRNFEQRPLDEAGATQQAVSERLMSRLRNAQPSGRVVMQLEPGTQELPDLLLENGDRLYIPPLPTSIGVYGSVYNPGNYLFVGNRTLVDYLRLAGSATRQADADSVFVVRANGSVESLRQYATFLGIGSSNFEKLPAQPGDTIVVPDEINKPSTTANLKDWAQIVYQFVLGFAAIKAF